MIKKLRNRFLFITMSLLTLVLLIIFSALIISSANRMETDSFRNLEEEYSRISRYDRAQAPDSLISAPLVKKEKPFDGFSPFSTFFVTLDSEGNIQDVDDFSRELTEDTFVDAAQAVLDQKEPEGVINRLNLRYKIFDQSTEMTVIGFIDISFERSFVRQQVLNYSFIGAGSLIAFFLISLLLSKIAIKPVKTAWEKQQQFIADASHELKTPVTVMLANTSILMSGNAGDAGEKEKWIGYIDLEARRMKTLIENMLFLAKVDSKENDAVHLKISMSEAVLMSALPFEALAYESGKTLATDIEKDIAIKGDESQIQQLVCILLDNANKYADIDSVIRISLKKQGTKAVLEIKNTGEPIDPKDIPYIFDRFVRIDKARTGGKNSYGLGLAIAKEIVTAHHGKIYVTSSKESGTVFSVVLPSV